MALSRPKLMLIVLVSDTVDGRTVSDSMSCWLRLVSSSLQIYRLPGNACDEWLRNNLDTEFVSLVQIKTHFNEL